MQADPEAERAVERQPLAFPGQRKIQKIHLSYLRLWKPEFLSFASRAIFSIFLWDSRFCFIYIIILWCTYFIYIFNRVLVFWRISISANHGYMANNLETKFWVWQSHRWKFPCASDSNVLQSCILYSNNTSTSDINNLKHVMNKVDVRTERGDRLRTLGNEAQCSLCATI